MKETWGDDSQEWTDKLKNEVGFTLGKDETLWMPFDDFTQQF